MEKFLADLHVHTVLSPCAEVEMIPPLIVREALERGIRLIAVTDHNSSANAAAVIRAAAGSPLVVLPGMEVQTREEVHVVCLFDTVEQLAGWQAQIDTALPAVKNDPDHFGEQFIVDETGDFLERETRLLLNSVEMGLEQVVRCVLAAGGLVFPAHVDRKAFGLLANLGFVPPGLPVDAVEISRWLSPADALRRYPHLAGYPLIQNGDVHRLDEFLGANQFEVEAASIAEIRMAFTGKNGRKNTILPQPLVG